MPIARSQKRAKPASRSAAPTPPARREGVRRTPSRPRAPLGYRRRARRKKVIGGVLIALGLLLVAALILVWQPFLRIKHVRVEGADADALAPFVERELIGVRYGILPRSSIFFLPEADIRAALLAAHPEIEAVSLKPSGLSTLVVKPAPRTGVVWWCGTLEAPLDPCYETDSAGLVFAEVPLAERYATSSALTVYAPLADAPTGTTPPVGSTLAVAAKLPALLEFVKAIRALGADVVSISIRHDEADLYTKAGTRITYVLGREQQAANLAASAFPDLSLNDGSLLYVDLRFESKVYFKKR